MMVQTPVERWERRLDMPLTISTIAFLVAYAWPILSQNYFATHVEPSCG
jgi:hypothetical protein